ncbi:MAG TPA: IS1634 family transposase, partial [Streptosporangiaceae bacterium]
MDAAGAANSGPFELSSQRLGALPLVNHFLARAGLPGLLERYLPATDARVRLAPATAVRLVVTNLLLGRRPLYGLGEWAARFAPGQLGLVAGEVDAVNDDRVGRALERLFDTDRASLLTELMLAVIAEFGIDTAELHNDSTSISVHGAYRSATGTPRGGKPTPVITFGHSKDHRPDLKQLVWILTVAADGAVPIAYRLADGNTTDDPTHVPTWDQLVTMLGRVDFLYVADSKLCSREAMGHIAAAGGRFVTILPRSRGEDRWFRDWAQTHQPQWTEAVRLPGPRADEPDQVYSVFAAPLPSAEGYRIVWVHSTAKAARDAAARQARIEAGAAALDALAIRLAGPKCRLKTRVAVEDEAAAALAHASADRWIRYEVGETVEETYRQERRGRPGANT